MGSEPFQRSMGPAERFARYQNVGRVKDVTVFAAEVPPSDPWLLLGAVTQSSWNQYRISGTHYDWSTRLQQSGGFGTSLPRDGVTFSDSTDVVYPYDWAESISEGALSLRVCSAAGFTYPRITTQWEGENGGPGFGTGYVETSTEVTGVDDYSRVTAVREYGDTSRTDDDLCRVTTYATSQSGLTVLATPSAIELNDCALQDGQTKTLSKSFFYYDNLPCGGCYTLGRPTMETAELYATGTPDLSQSGTRLKPEFALSYTTYDTLGNPASVCSTREDGKSHCALIAYDPFKLAPVLYTTQATDLPTLTTAIGRDPLTLAAQSTRDPNGVETGVEYDGFQRVKNTSVTPAHGTKGYMSKVEYLGFTAGDGAGRRIEVMSFDQPVADDQLPTATGLRDTVHLDAHGRKVGAKASSVPTIQAHS